MKVKGRWKYLNRAITKKGKTLDFYLSPTRKGKAAKRFLGEILRRMKEYEKPETRLKTSNLITMHGVEAILSADHHEKLEAV